MPIGSNVKHSVKLQIWQHKFVELNNLLYPNSNNNYFLSFNAEGNSPTLNLAPRKNRPLSDSEWGAAMDIVVAIYLQRYPNQLNQILTYVHYVKDLMKQGANWRLYDTQFRQDREYSHCPWNAVRQDLELRPFRPFTNNTFQKLSA